MRKVNNPTLHLIVIGDGPLNKEFEKKAAGLNVTFVGRLPYEQMCGVLTACDMVVNPIVGSSVATIINKHADYAACGKPVVNTQKSEEYRNLINQYEMGFNCDNNDINDLAKRISSLMDDENLCKRMGKNARECADERFDRNSTYIKLMNMIEGR